MSCKTTKVNKMDSSVLEIKYNALGTCELKYCANIEKLFIWNTKSILTSSYIDYSVDIDAINEERQIFKELENLQNFKNVKEIYFMNFCFSKLPESILDMKKLEVLQIDYYKHFNVEEEYFKISKFQNLKKLVLNTFILPSEKVTKLRALLPHIEIFSLLD